MTTPTINLRTLSIDKEGLTLFIGPLEAAIMRALWNNASTSRAIFRDVRENYKPDRTDELSFTSVTSTIDRLYDRGYITRTGDRSGYTYAPAYATEEAFVYLCVNQVLKTLIDWYPREVATTIKQYIATKGFTNAS